MSSFNGFGTTFYGRKYFNPKDESSIKIKWIIFGFLPFIPLRAYRIIMGETKDNFWGIFLSSSTPYTILGEVPLKANLDLILSTYLKIWGGLIFFILSFWYPFFFLIPAIIVIKFFIDEIKIRKLVNKERRGT